MWQQLRQHRQVVLAIIGGAALIAAACVVAVLRYARATPPDGQPTLTQVPVQPVAQPTTDSPQIAVPQQPPKPVPAPVSDRALITFSTIPATNAKVMWGKKQLGVITPKLPLVISRPRDSGPLDVMIYAPGYLPVQTRAHTFGDTKIQVKLTTPEQKQTLFGYRAPLDAGVLPEDSTGLPPTPSELPPPAPGTP